MKRRIEYAWNTDLVGQIKEAEPASGWEAVVDRKTGIVYTGEDKPDIFMRDEVEAMVLEQELERVSIEEQLRTECYVATRGAYVVREMANLHYLKAVV